MRDLFRALLALHLFCALGATAIFWVAAALRKGSTLHRATGRWFARFVYATAVTGGVMAIASLTAPAMIHAPQPDLSAEAAAAAAASLQQTMWLVLYVLVIIVAPVQHGAAVAVAGPAPTRVKSLTHSVLAFAGIAGTVLITIGAVLWHQWLFLIVSPIGLVVGLRNLNYARRSSAQPADWRREHLTSLITAGVTLHTAFFVFGTSRTLGLALTNWTALLPWTVSALVGLPVILWARRRMKRGRWAIE